MTDIYLFFKTYGHAHQQYLINILMFNINLYESLSETKHNEEIVSTQHVVSV